MNWKIGQKLVCMIDYGNSNPATQGKPVPKKDEIVIFDGSAYTQSLYLADQYNYFAWDGRVCFQAKFFRPLIGESAKSELVSSFKEVTETSDCPMIPETETA